MSDPHLPVSQAEKNAPSHTQGQAGVAPTRDGRKLFYMQHPGPVGTAAPTVVFENGMAANRSWWALAQPKVAQWARAVVYDRSGLGRSAPDHKPRTLARLSDDLNDLLDHLDPGPFILVGHSAGGPIIRAATAARPERIAGLVLVDATDEACDLLFEKSFRHRDKIALLVAALFARLGLLHLPYAKLTALLPADAKADIRREGFTADMVRTLRTELKDLMPSLEALRQKSIETPDIPITLISGALANGGMTPRMRAAANASHAYRATRSPHGRHVLAPNSGHMVPATDPDLIVAEIKRIIDDGPATAGRSEYPA